MGHGPKIYPYFKRTGQKILHIYRKTKKIQINIKPADQDPEQTNMITKKHIYGHMITKKRVYVWLTFKLLLFYKRYFKFIHKYEYKEKYKYDYKKKILN